jgi:hypothetical protein
MDRFDLLSIRKSVQRDLDVWTEAISGIEAREVDGQFLRGVYTELRYQISAMFFDRLCCVAQ